MPKSPKTKKIVTAEKDLIVPVGDMQFNGTTEAEYQEPVVPKNPEPPVDPVDDYLQKTYPGLGQNIPNILHAILREIVIGRLK